MINLKKIVAVTMAATMCMGLGITSFAADSDLVSANRSDLVSENVQSDYYLYPNVSNKQQVEQVEAINNEGEKNSDLLFQSLRERGLTEAGKESLERTMNTINTKQEVINILRQNGVIASQYGKDVNLDELTIVPVASADIYHLGTNGNYMAFKLGPNDFNKDGNDPGKYQEGDTVVAMLESGQGTGVWRVATGTVDANGEVVFETNTTGAVILIKATKKNVLVQMTVDQNGDPIAPPTIIPTEPTNPDDGTSQTPANGQNTANANNANASTNAFTSPKTGEF